MMKLKIQHITAKRLCLARAQEMNFNTVGIFCNMLEKVANEDLSDTPGNIFSICQSGKQINDTPKSVIREIGSKNGRVLTSGGKIKIFTVTTCCNPAGQFLLPVLIFHGHKRKEDFGDRLPPE
jgi:hypothetical protein